METKEIIEKLKGIKENKLYKDLEVKNVIVHIKDNNKQSVSIILNQEVDQYMTNRETGVRELGKTNVIFVTVVALTGFLKSTKEFGFIADYAASCAEEIRKDGDLTPYNVIFENAKIDIIQEFAENGKEYKSPFSTTEKTTIFDEDRYFSHVIKLVPSENTLDILQEMRRDIMRPRR